MVPPNANVSSGFPLILSTIKMKKLSSVESAIFSNLVDTIRFSLPLDYDTEDECIGYFNNAGNREVCEDEPTLKLRPSS